MLSPDSHRIERVNQDRRRLDPAHCSAMRETVRDNRRLVEQSIEVLLSSKDLLRSGAREKIAAARTKPSSTPKRAVDLVP